MSSATNISLKFALLFRDQRKGKVLAFILCSHAAEGRLLRTRVRALPSVECGSFTDLRRFPAALLQLRDVGVISPMITKADDRPS